ncbi:MAG: PqqD family protein [Candidatus Krumholzibacteriia bacterium]
MVRRVGDETVFLSEDGRSIHTMNEVGSFLWSQIDGRTSVSQLRDALMGAYDVEPEQAESDLQEFLTRLHDAGLLTLQE